MYDVEALPAYVQENRLPLLAASILKGKTVEVINRMSGVKGKAALNLVDIGANFAPGNECGFNDTTEDAFSQRVLETYLIKLEKEWCWKDLIGKWNEYEYRVVAGDKSLAFEEFFLNEIAKKVAAQIEKMIWQGDTSIHANFGGLLRNLSTEVAGTPLTGTTAYENIMQVYMAIPEEVLDKAAIFVSADNFRALVAALVQNNLYHYNPGAPVDEIILPGTNTRVIKVNGLNNAPTWRDSTRTSFNDVIVAADPDNLFYGYDIEDSERAMDMWYSKDNDSIRLRITTNIGTQVAFPNQVIVAGTPA